MSIRAGRTSIHVVHRLDVPVAGRPSGRWPATAHAVDHWLVTFQLAGGIDPVARRHHPGRIVSRPRQGRKDAVRIGRLQPRHPAAGGDALRRGQDQP